MNNRLLLLLILLLLLLLLLLEMTYNTFTVNILYNLVTRQ